MKWSLQNSRDAHKAKLTILPAFQKVSKDKKGKETKEIQLPSFNKEIKEAFHACANASDFKGDAGSSFRFHTDDGRPVLIYGFGEKKSLTSEKFRKGMARICKAVANTESVYMDIDLFNLAKGSDKSAEILAEAFLLTTYKFDKYLAKSKPYKLKEVVLGFKDTRSKTKIQKAIDSGIAICESVNFARNLVNEPPNVLHSEAYPKLVEEDVKKNLKGKRVKIKILKKAELKKEKMGLFLSVNAGSQYQPHLVHLSYTPKKVTKKTKHIVLVGKGLVFDTGGISLKPSASIINMKFDMAGSSTVYGAFRAAALKEVNCKVTCILGITDNAISDRATLPDSIIKARNGKTVEILNTDAEGRLVLADCLDYACDLKPDGIINAATLTGAMLVALGTEICGVFSNNDKWAADILKSSKNTDEYAWHMPVIPEWHKDMKSPIADLKNIGGSSYGGSGKAAAFLENFIKNDIPWAHMDIAGVGDSQSHLPYCPAKGGSGVMVRTLVDLLSRQ